MYILSFSRRESFGLACNSVVQIKILPTPLPALLIYSRWPGPWGAGATSVFSGSTAVSLSWTWTRLFGASAVGPWNVGKGQGSGWDPVGGTPPSPQNILPIPAGCGNRADTLGFCLEGTVAQHPHFTHEQTDSSGLGN